MSALTPAAVVEIVRLVLTHGVGPVLKAISRAQTEEPTVEEIEKLVVEPPTTYFKKD